MIDCHLAQFTDSPLRGAGVGGINLIRDISKKNPYQEKR
jgi:hypothetical protein